MVGVDDARVPGGSAAEALDVLLDNLAGQHRDREDGVPVANLMARVGTFGLLVGAAKEPAGYNPGHGMLSPDRTDLQSSNLRPVLRHTDCIGTPCP